MFWCVVDTKTHRHLCLVGVFGIVLTTHLRFFERYLHAFARMDLTDVRRERRGGILDFFVVSFCLFHH